MQPRRNPLSLFAAATLLLLAVGTFFALRRSPEDIERDRLKKAAQRLKKQAKNDVMNALQNANAAGAELSGMDDQGRPLWTVGADKSQLRTDENGATHAILTGARATLYREGKPESSFRSAKMELTRDADDKVKLQLSGGVTARTQAQAVQGAVQSKTKNLVAPGALQMSAPQVAIDVNARRLAAAQGVVFTQGSGAQSIKVTAPQMQADMGLTSAQLSGGVVATAPQGTFKAQSATWNWKSNRASAQGGVTASHEGTVLTGARLDADAQGKSGTVSGDVKITAPQGRASAARVTYNWAAGRLSATGGVQLSKGDASLRAARIEADAALKNAVASGGVTLAKDGVRLTAERAEATQGLSRASASGGVTITKDGATLRAARVDSFDNFARAVASGAVHLTKGEASLRAGRAEVFDRASRAVASGGVTLRQGEFTVTAAGATATNLDQKGALRVTASGGVTASNGASTVRAARVTWGGGQIKASGGVRARHAGLDIAADNFAGDDKGRHAVLSGDVVVKHPNGASLQAPSARYDKAAHKVWASGSAKGSIVFKDGAGGVLRGNSLVADLNLKKAEVYGVDGSVNTGALKGQDLF